jgi:hypothetical protein
MKVILTTLFCFFVAGAAHANTAISPVSSHSLTVQQETALIIRVITKHHMDTNRCGELVCPLTPTTNIAQEMDARLAFSLIQGAHYKNCLPWPKNLVSLSSGDIPYYSPRALARMIVESLRVYGSESFKGFGCR